MRVALGVGGKAVVRWAAGLLGACVVVAAPPPAAGDDWPRFRGPDGTGVSNEVGLPTELSPEKNLVWKVEGLEGTSSPVVSGGRLFLTAFRGDERLVRCLDAATGETLWTRGVKQKRQEVATPPCGPATPTPVADGPNVYAFFPDSGLVCYSRDGDERWQVPLGPFHSFHGVSSSLVAAEEDVFVLVDQVSDSFLAAYDGGTGREGWKVSRPDGPIGGYSTPAARRTAAGKVELVVSGPLDVTAYDPATGRPNWTVTGVTNAPISTPAAAGDRVFVCEPSFTENPFKMESLLTHDKNNDGKLSLAELESMPPLRRLAEQVDRRHGNGDGEVEAAEIDAAFKSFVGGGGLAAIEAAGTGGEARVKWTYRKSVPHVPSVIHYRDVLYFVNDGGILTSVNPASGDILKRGRLGHGSRYYASPVAGDGRLYLIDTEGKIAVVQAGADWKAVSTGDLGEGCYATPAIANRRVYVRGERTLFCFAGGDAPAGDRKSPQ